MPLLLRRRDKVKDHWHAAAHDLGTVLPGVTNTYRARWEDPVGTAATLLCQQFPDERASRDNGVVISIVPLIAAARDESPLYWIGWYEEWVPERRITSRWLQFLSSAITIYYGESGRSKRQLLRAEWAGVRSVEKQREIFPGRGAAHPHWHVDALRSYLNDIGQQIESSNREAELNRELAADRVREFGGEAEQDVAQLFTPPSIRLPEEADLRWATIHLAANARWAETPWPGPEGPHDMHAAGPENEQALRRWLVSCVRYIQAEINKV